VSCMSILISYLHHWGCSLLTTSIVCHFLLPFASYTLQLEGELWSHFFRGFFFGTPQILGGGSPDTTSRSAHALHCWYSNYIIMK
jgi:hypothetical protein